ncbi:unnamed protein product, partial [Mesorhabditis belari]|uniref:protein-tyrosine-phosphatase n=1 Tax=Mesorhabditis belari TaxID=2138241 RepID=A0AAF3EJJ2_9BILA
MGIDQILPHLWISDRKAASNKRVLGKYEIAEILTVCLDPISWTKQYGHIRYHHIALDDEPMENILTRLEELLSILEEAISSNRSILVHCEAGISRSAAVCCAYVMRRNSCSTKEALNHVRSSHWQCHPNEGFIKQLEIFEKLLWKADEKTLEASENYGKWLTANGKTRQNGRIKGEANKNQRDGDDA